MVLAALLCGFVAPADAATVWRYNVRGQPGLAVLEIDAQLSRSHHGRFSVDDGAEPFVEGVELETAAGRWQPIRMNGRDASWHVPACSERACHLRYRFRLAAAAAALGSETAEYVGEGDGAAIQAPPSTWLLHPLGVERGAQFRFRVTMPPGLAFASGVASAQEGDPNLYEADVSDLEQTPYSVFGRFQLAHVDRPGGRIDVALVPAQRQLADGELLAWIGAATNAVTAYYGRFPVRRVLIIVVPGDGRDVHGTTLGNGGASIRLPVGVAATAEDLRQDWVLTHELVHLALPSVARRSHWLEEGLATYLEPILRARVGQLDVETVWADLVRGLPQGEPEAGDRGLDQTPTWGRTYWGGALFCLLADVRIRQRTQNRRSLDDALRAIVAQGGNISVRWPIERVLDEGDRGTGVTVLRELWAEHGRRPVSVDLKQLWRQLGVRLRGGRVRFDDDAPLAGLRRAITEPTAARRTLAK